jgi:hypothetical protein
MNQGNIFFLSERFNHCLGSGHCSAPFLHRQVSPLHIVPRAEGLRVGVCGKLHVVASAKLSVEAQSLVADLSESAGAKRLYERQGRSDQQKD